MSQNEDAIANLSDAWHARKLTIVIGAGVSAGSGLPLWSGLLNNILNRYIDLKYSEEKVSFLRMR